MLITTETKAELKESVEKTLGETTKELESLARTYLKLQVSERFSEERELKVDFQAIKNLINYRLFIGLLTSDLCCAILDYLNAKFQYQGLFSARQIVVIIREGYEKIYHFKFKNAQGDLVSKHRNSSFWIKEIGHLIKDFPEFKLEYNSITQKLDSYTNINFELLKEQRDLSIHYDKEPMKVIKMLTALNIEETFEKMLPFLQILNEMFSFTSNLSQEYSKKTDIAKNEINKKFSDLQSLMVSSKTAENQNVIDDLSEKISGLNPYLNK